jgi:hypothetical protein
LTAGDPTHSFRAVTAPPARARSAAVALATLVVWVAAMVLLTWPLGAHLATHVLSSSPVARMDTLHSLWVLSWESHALATAPTRFLDANVYAPEPRALLFSTMGLATLPWFAPTFLVTGNPVLAANLAFLSCLALAAWGLHRVVEGWTASWLAGLVAGAAFVLSPWVSWTWTPPRPIHVALLYFPWIVAIVAVPGWSVRRTIAIAVLVALQCLVDPIYVAPGVLLTIGLVALGRMARPSTRTDGRALLAALVFAVLVLAPIYAGYDVVRATNPGLATQSAWAPSGDHRAAALDGFVLAGGIWADLRPTGVPGIVLPLLACGLASFAIRRRDDRASTRAAWLHAGLWTAVGLLVSTRSLIWPGDPPIVVASPLFVLVDRLAPALMSTLRGTVRLGIIALPAIALLAGLAFAECARRLPRAATLVVALAVVAAMYARWPGRGAPYPIATVPPSRGPILDALKAGAGPVLELPAGTGPFDTTRQAEAMYRSIFHWRPLVNGYASYWPRGFPARMALAAELPDATAWEALRRATGVTSVVVHRVAPRYADWTAIATRDDGPFRVVARDGDDLLVEPSR